MFLNSICFSWMQSLVMYRREYKYESCFESHEFGKTLYRGVPGLFRERSRLRRLIDQAEETAAMAF